MWMRKLTVELEHSLVNLVPVRGVGGWEPRNVASGKRNGMTHVKIKQHEDFREK